MTTVAEAGTDIVALVEATPVLVLTDKQKFSEFYEAMKRECDAHEPNLETESGRKKIASLAYKVARTKTAINEAGKKLNEDRAAKEEAERKARAEREAEEKRNREADRAHRGKIMGAAKEALIAIGPVDEDVAKTIVLAIAAGSIPHVTMQF